MARDPSTTARDFAFGRESQPSLKDWLVRDLRIAGSTERPAAPDAPGEVEGAAPAEPPAMVAEPDALDEEVERYEPIQVEAIDGGVDVAAAGSFALAETVAAGTPHGVLPPPNDERPPAGELEAAAATKTGAAAGVSSDTVMSPPGDWLDETEDDLGAASAFFASSDDLDDPDATARVTNEPMGASLSPQVLDPEEDDDGGVVPIAPGGGASSHWKAILAVAAAVLLAFLFMHRVAKRHPQAAAASPVPAATVSPPKAPVAEGSSEATPQGEDVSATEETKGRTVSGGGRAHAGPTDSRSADPAVPGGPSVARFPDLPREILMQLEQVFESESAQRGKAPSDSTERYTR